MEGTQFWFAYDLKGGTQFWVPYDPQRGPSSWVSMIFRGDTVLCPLLWEGTQFWVPYDLKWGPSFGSPIMGGRGYLGLVPLCSSEGTQFLGIYELGTHTYPVLGYV